MTLPTIAKRDIPLGPWSLPSRRYLNPGEIEVLLSLVSTVQPTAMVEFGVNEGLTASAVLSEIKSIEKYWGVDVPIGYKTECQVQRGEVPRQPGVLAASDPRFELVLRKNGSLDLTSNDIGPCDAVFIDGDHGRRAVTHDTALALAILRSPGIIIWHDYHDGPVHVKSCLEQMRDEGRDIVHVEDTWLAFERIN